MRQKKPHKKDAVSIGAIPKIYVFFKTFSKKHKIEIHKNI